MVYTNRPSEIPSERQVVMTNGRDFGDRVHWGAIFAGVVMAISSQLLLSAIGAAIGLSSIAGSGAPRSEAGGVSDAVGIWAIISLFISLFIGGWTTARTYGSINRSTAILNGVILWATTLAISSWLLTSGVSGTFGVVTTNQSQQSGMNLPNTTRNMPPGAGTSSMQTDQTLSAQQTREIAGNAAKIGWGFTFGSLLGLAAATLGASVGARNSHTLRRDSDEAYHQA